MAAGSNVASRLFTLPKAVSLVASKLYFYRTGTSTAATVYTNIALTIAHSNPVVADSSGYFAPIYIDGAAGDLRVSHFTSADVLIYTIDNYLAGYGSTDSININAANNPLIQLVQSGAASGKKNWYIQAEAEQLKLSAVNDAFSVEGDFMTVSRSGTTATLINFATTSLTYNTAPVLTGNGATKTSVESRNTTTTLATDSALVLSLVGSGKFIIDCGLYFYATTTAGMGFKFDVSGSGGTSIFNGRAGPMIQHINGTGAVGALNTLGVTPISFATISTNSNAVDSVQFSIYAETGAAGTVFLRWAQVSSSANNLNLANCSWIRATKIQ